MHTTFHRLDVRWTVMSHKLTGLYSVDIHLRFSIQKSICYPCNLHLHVSVFKCV